MSATMNIIIEGKDRASAAFDSVKSKGSGAAKSLQDNWKKVTMAGAAAGAAVEGLARQQATLTEQTNRLAAATDMTEKEMRELAISTSDVTFPLNEVLDVMEAGRQQGLRSAEQLEEYAEFWDMVGDATGESASRLAESSAALRAVGIAAGEEKEAVSAFGFVAQETTGSVSEFMHFLDRTGPEVREFGMDINDTAAMLGIMEHELGMSGRTARSEFRQALNEADGDMQKLFDTLGITEEQFARYNEKVNESSGVIERNAEIHGESYTLMQRVQHRVSELTYAFGEQIQTASNLSMILIGLGPALRIASTATYGLGVAVRFLISPIGIAITALTALVAVGAYVQSNWDWISKRLRATWELISSSAQRIAYEIASIWYSAQARVQGAILRLMESIDNVLGRIPLVGDVFGDLVKGMQDRVTESEKNADRFSKKQEEASQRSQNALKNIGTEANKSSDVVSSAMDRTGGTVANKTDEMNENIDATSREFDKLGGTVANKTDDMDENIDATSREFDELGSSSTATGEAIKDSTKEAADEAEGNLGRIAESAKNARVAMDSLGYREQREAVSRSRFGDYVASRGGTADAVEFDEFTDRIDDAAKERARSEGVTISVGRSMIGTEISRGEEPPEFHQGGLFRTNPPGGEGLALLRHGEKVTTSQQQGDIDYQKLAQVIVKAIREGIPDMQIVQYFNRAMTKQDEKRETEKTFRKALFSYR